MHPKQDIATNGGNGANALVEMIALSRGITPGQTRELTMQVEKEEAVAEVEVKVQEKEKEMEKEKEVKETKAKEKAKAKARTVKVRPKEKARTAKVKPRVKARMEKEKAKAKARIKVKENIKDMEGQATPPEIKARVKVNRLTVIHGIPRLPNHITQNQQEKNGKNGEGQPWMELQVDLIATNTCKGSAKKRSVTFIISKIANTANTVPTMPSMRVLTGIWRKAEDAVEAVVQGRRKVAAVPAAEAKEIDRQAAKEDEGKRRKTKRRRRARKEREKDTALQE